MKINMRSIALFAAVSMAVGSSACAQKAKKGAEGEMKTEMDSLSYIFGSGLGQNIRQAEIEGVNPDILLQGLKDALVSDSSMKINTEDGNTLVRSFMQAQQAKKAEAGIAKAKAYMDGLAKDAALKSTASGIYYKVLTQGTGAKPLATEKVKVNYEGKTTEGKVFDSSYERGTPAEFPLNRVIPGWTEMLQLMEVGTTVEATIPPALAYGERGAGGVIPANATLIFEVELLGVGG